MRSESRSTTATPLRPSPPPPRSPLPPLLTPVARLRAMDRIEARLRRGWPRLQMSLIVLITGAAGFVSSFLLLHAGMTRMVVRYPLAVASAYAVFLGCLWVWRRQPRLHARRREGADASSLDPMDFDVTSVDFSFGGHPPTDTAAFEGFGRGGGFSGSGGGSSWGGGANAGTVRSVGAHANSAGDVASHAGGIDVGGFDVDEGIVVLVPLVIAAALAGGVVLYVIYIAPSLFAELLLDTALSAGLYRRLYHNDGSSWIACALRRTVVPVVFVALLLGLAGWWMQGFYPEAASIGRVWERLQEPRRAP